MVIKDDADLDKYIHLARTTNQPLFIETAFVIKARQQFPRTVARLENPAEFQIVDALRGTDEAESTHTIYRWTGTPSPASQP